MLLALHHLSTSQVVVDMQFCSTTLWLFNIAMENDPFIDDFPMKTSIYSGFSMAMLNNQMVITLAYPDPCSQSCKAIIVQSYQWGL